MSGITSSNPRTSLSVRAAVTITALITWGFSAFVGCLHANSSPSVQTQQIELGTATPDRNSREG